MKGYAHPMPTYHVITYGCQMNDYDSERVAGLLAAEAWEAVPDAAGADVVLLNTCAIREKAEEKVFSRLGELRQLKARHPGMVIGVLGCMAQLHGAEIRRRAAHVDLVVGSPALARLPRLVDHVRRARRPVVDRAEAPLVKLTARAPGAAPPLRAHVTVMEGCDHGCTFCVVPTTRGRERSHPPEAILDEVRGLVSLGCREVTLLGQTVNAWGRDLAPPTDLAALFRLLDAVPGLARIRFTTSNPYNLTPSLIDALATVPKVCEYLHLPLQSGSNRVLGAMRRGYTRETYLDLVDELRRRVHGLALSTDLIVGFPGETEADFRETLDMVETVGFDNVFAFRYSPRPGTPAADLPDQVPLEVKAERNARVLAAAGRAAAARVARLVGRQLEVLVDGAARRDAAMLSGRTRCNRVVNFRGPNGVAPGDLVMVRIDEGLPHSLRGTLIEPVEAACSSR